MRVALLLAVASMGLGGCASLSQTEPVERDDGIDRAKVTAVETQAQRTGVRVHWVNLPRKPVQ
jgi:uncharacterized protein YceK